MTTRGARVVAARATTVGVLVALAVTIVVPLAADAQPSPKVPRIGFLAPLSLAGDPRLPAFLQGLRELGYEEGRNITIEYRFAEGRPERLPGLAADLVRMKVDVIVTGQPPAAMAAKAATGTIPIVFTVAGDPVAEGFVSSLARPGGNMTGLASIAPALMGKQLELLREVVPGISRVAVLANPINHGHPPQLRQTEDAARALRLQLQILNAGSTAEIEAAFAAMRSHRASGLLVLRDPLFVAQRDRIAALAIESRLPAVHGVREEAAAGGLVAYGASNSEMLRRAATFVDRILKGATPADLPVEQPTTFELVINLKTARALGVTIPPSLLLRADQVIE
jgi:ABC-type uncharacterized transport system substrate-binding protein